VTSLTTNPRAVLCHYARDPARRPHCTLTAEISLGAVALCGSCAAARSTLGKGMAAVPLPPGPAVDVLDWVADASLAAGQACRDLDAAVTRARSAGYSWARIAGRLGVTRQAAAQRYRHQPSQRNEG
jgi:hypothetical protein